MKPLFDSAGNMMIIPVGMSKAPYVYWNGFKVDASGRVVVQG